jgi:hypothetical protein
MVRDMCNLRLKGQNPSRTAGEGGAHCEASAKQWEGEGASKAWHAGAVPSPGAVLRGAQDHATLSRSRGRGRDDWCLRGRFERPSRRLKGGFSAIELRRHGIGARPAIRTRNLRFLRPAPLPIGPAAHVGGPAGSRTPATRLEDGCSLPARQGLCNGAPERSRTSTSRLRRPGAVSRRRARHGGPCRNRTCQSSVRSAASVPADGPIGTACRSRTVPLPLERRGASPEA